MSLTTTITRAAKKGAAGTKRAVQKAPRPVVSPRRAVLTRFEVEPKPVPLSTCGIWHHLTIGPDGLWAWFQLGPQHWRFKATDERDMVLSSGSQRWSDLAGHRIHVIRDAPPFDYAEWAKNLDNNTPNPLTPKQGPTFRNYYEAAQLRLAELEAREPVAYLGVRITKSNIRYKDLAVLLGDDHDIPTLLVKTRARLREVTASIAREGFDGEPLTVKSMGLLMHSMVGLGAPAPATLVENVTDGWAAHEMSDFTDPVVPYAKALNKTTEVNVLREGRQHQSHVAVLEVSRLGEQRPTTARHQPWMSYSDSFDFPCVWSMQMDVEPGKNVAKVSEFNRRRAEDRRAHEIEHHDSVPPAVERAIDDARRIEDEVKEGDESVSVRLAGPIYVAVKGVTPDDASEKANVVASRYSLKCNIALHHGYGQFYRYRSFIPGEPHPAAGFIRQMPAYYVPSALPNIASKVGDDEGPYLGMAGHTPVFFDPTWGPRNNQSGVIVIGGTLGSGKTALAGTIAEASARRGHKTRIFDPSGNMQALGLLPHLKDNSVHVELGAAQPGAFNPYWLVPDPPRHLFDTDVEHRAAKAEAKAERAGLVIDTLVKLLHPDLVRDSKGRIPAGIRHVVEQFDSAHSMNPWMVVRELEHSKDEVLAEAGRALRDVSAAKGPSLVFPEDQMSARVSGDTLPDATQVIVTMRGIEIPEGANKDNWNDAERLAAPVLHLAARYMMLATYADQDPKVIIMDESAILAGEPGSIRSVLRRVTYETRKTNTMLGIIAQNPEPFLAIDKQFPNLIGAAFWGRTNSHEVAQAALKLMDIPQDQGYDKVLRGLKAGAGDFIHKDWHGNVNRIAVDLMWRPDLLGALDSTPKQATREDQAPADDLPEEAEGLVFD